MELETRMGALETRMGVAELLSLVRAEQYFVVYAPRQTGKTSALLALRDLLNSGTAGEYRCAYINVESAQTAREDVGRAMKAIALQIAGEAEDTLNDAATADAVLRYDPAGVPSERGSVRCAERARLPHPRQLREGGDHGRQRLQHQGQVSPSRGFQAGGGLDMGRLLAAFQDFFRQNSEHWVQRAQYTEAGPQLVLQAFLHRVVNGRGRIEREYALGSRRVDLLVIWPDRQGAASRWCGAREPDGLRRYSAGICQSRRDETPPAPEARRTYRSSAVTKTPPRPSATEWYAASWNVTP